ncbi:MAG TPA: succinate dehydrogenase cytochrome b subunit [Phaeodactylibacter sp.]|nr:succinate dehydrogenase cytochrome b subunit [Phaeodactylibacter sp.]
MSWITNFLFSSIGRKIIMSLTGLFLILFLLVHLMGNLQLLANDGGESFNLYAKMMTTNPLIKVISYGNYFFILLHAIMGMGLWMRNKAARGSRYAVATTANTSFSSRNMAWFGIVIFVFIVLHMVAFWGKMHFGSLPLENYGHETDVKNLYIPVAEAFSSIGVVIFYVVCMIIIGLHLNHGFQSAFQTLGLNHKKYTPFIKGLGTAYSILIPLGFAIIPIFFFLFRNVN